MLVAGPRPDGGRPSRGGPPVRLVGLKLELTHACNLRCGFCYTDSPRHTVARTADLDDDQCRRVVDEALELGIIEAVVTGGEPLLRAPLAFELIERLAASGVGVVLNTNGWFVGGGEADRLAAAPGLLVQVSVDGAAARVHDAGRGVPGSWRRAIGALDLLLDRGVRVAAVGLITPENQAYARELIVSLGLLGAPVIRVFTVVPVGGAVRRGDWGIRRAALEAAVTSAQDELGRDVRVHLHSPEAAFPKATQAPRAVLVRPNGDVLIDSMHPFSFGKAQDGLATAWEAILQGWDAPRMHEYRDRLQRTRDYRAGPIPYFEPDALDARLPRPGSGSEGGLDAHDLADARAAILALAEARGYRAADLRWSGDVEGDRIVRMTSSGRVLALNRTAGIVLDALADGTPRAAADALHARHPEVDRGLLLLDALRLTRWMLARGVIAPAAAGRRLALAAPAPPIDGLAAAALP